MICYLLLLIILIFFGISTKKIDEKPLNMQYTDVLKGLGILIVFVDHIRGYFSTYHCALFPLDSYVLVVFQLTTTLMVGMFLFFSGYGVTLSILNKGNLYVNAMPRKRILTTLLNFDVAVLTFLIIDFILKIDVSPLKAGLSFIGWESIGNSNWYIFAILCCYLFSYISNKLCKNIYKAVLLTFIMVIAYIIILWHYKEPWWYNTIAGYLGGAFYAVFKNKINIILYRYYYTMLFVCFALFAIFFRFSSNFVSCNIAILLFGLLLILFSMKYSLRNKFLIWCGKHLFPLYIYQRLPMIVIPVLFAQFVTAHPYIYFIICFAITLLIAKWVPLFKLNQINTNHLYEA